MNDHDRLPEIPPLFLDLYELTMGQSYVDEGIEEPSTFSLYARHLPPVGAFS